jgi:rubrerythrin
MKTFKQAYEVLNDARKFHQDMAHTYEELMERSSDNRTQLLLKHMVEHEQRMARNLENYGAIAKNKVMQTWLQYTHEESAQDFVRHLELSENPSIKEINTLGREVDRYFHDLYEAVYGAIESAEVKEVFEDLKQIQDKERITLSMATNSLWDM